MGGVVSIEGARHALKGRRKIGSHWENMLNQGLESDSLRKSINAHCYLCMGGQRSDPQTKSSITNLIEECASIICPLHNVRPRRK
jgi:hypothetical protein